MIINAVIMSEVTRKVMIRIVSSRASMRYSKSGGAKKKFRNAAAIIERMIDAARLPNSEMNVIITKKTKLVLEIPNPS